MCVYACVISEQLNQENGKSNGTGFFGKVRKTTISGKQQFYLVSVIADKLIYFIYITRTNFRSDIVGDLE